MSRSTAIRELIEGIGRLLRGPLPQPRPQPQPGPTFPRPQPQPQPAPRPPRDPDPRPGQPRPVPPPPTGERDPETEPQPETEPEATPEGETEGDVAPRTEEDDDCEDCMECEPRQMGSEVPSSYGSPDGREIAAHFNGYAYQHQICPWHAHNPAARTINEWSFAGLDYDGLHPQRCYLYETKYGYANFLVQNSWGPGARPSIDPSRPWGAGIMNDMVTKIQRRQDAITPYPRAKLGAYFSESITSIYVYERLLNSGYWMVERHYVAANFNPR